MESANRRPWGRGKRILATFIVIASLAFVAEIILGVVIFTSMWQDYPPTTGPTR